ncbi:hypothetical protein PG996_014874 [Apiospora saccharicola]|uniref:Sfi1 spindle body domain-containing protein n=1 Tax=Apiospora saccharicola TaxID=335842 RepID=A0ABR1TJJ2_9PEZI
MAPREFYENNVNAAWQRSHELLTTPVPGTNCRLETVARIIIRRAKRVFRYLDYEDDVTSSAVFAAEWEHFADAINALDYWHLQTRTFEKVIRDLKAMHAHYLSLKYQYHRYKAYQERQEESRRTPSPKPSQGQRDIIGALEQNIASHLLLGSSFWIRVSLELQEELRWLRQWEKYGSPKSKAPQTPQCTWLMETLDLFYINDVNATVQIIQSTLTRRSEPFDSMCNRHAKLVKESREQTALNEVDRDIELLTTWVCKEYDTEVLERAIVSYKDKILNYQCQVAQARARIARSQNGVQLRRTASGRLMYQRG